MREIYLSDYDIAAVEYIYDNYNKNVLFKMPDEALHMLVHEECNILSEANEELKYGTIGKNYDCDVNSELVFCYIIKERDEYNEINS